LKRILLLGAAIVAFVFTARSSCGENVPPKPAAFDILKQTRLFFSTLASAACEIDYLRVMRKGNNVIERESHFDVAIQRPNLLSILLKNDGNVTYAWISDGMAVSTYLAGAEKYMRFRAPATLEELFSGDEMRVVSGALDHAFLLDELLRRDQTGVPLGAQSAEYFALEELNGEKAHRLRLSVPPNKWDLWISAGPVPLPLKIHADISSADEKIEFTVEFKKWLPDVKLDPRAFQFDKESKAKRVSGFLPDEPPHPLLNQAAPAAALELIDGTRTSLAAHKGRDVVVLDFWSMSCVPCIGILPKVDAVAKKFKDKGVVFYAMNESDAADDVRAFLAKKGIVLSATLHNKEANFAAFKVDSIPKMFLIDKAGVIRAVHGVLTDDLVSELSAQIEALLAGREIPARK